jgi:hypothetical protein
MSDFRKYLNEQLGNPNFKIEWDKLESEYETIQNIIDVQNNIEDDKKL